MSTPDPVDIHVGSRIRLRRTLLGLSQEKLADSLGITFQQVQKYENGSNRVGASRLYRISTHLGIPVDYFFEGFQKDGQLSKVAEEKSKSLIEEPTILSSKETIELLRAYYSIDDSAVRRKILDMIKSVSGDKELKA